MSNNAQKENQNVNWKRITVDGQHLQTPKNERLHIWDLLITETISEDVEGDSWEYILVKACLDGRAMGKVDPCDHVIACDIDGKLKIPFMAESIKTVFQGEQRVVIEGRCTTKAPKSWNRK